VRKFVGNWWAAQRSGLRNRVRRAGCLGSDVAVDIRLALVGRNGEHLHRKVIEARKESCEGGADGCEDSLILGKYT
jgi:hypothetical protein